MEDEFSAISWHSPWRWLGPFTIQTAKNFRQSLELWFSGFIPLRATRAKWNLVTNVASPKFIFLISNLSTSRWGKVLSLCRFLQGHSQSSLLQTAVSWKPCPALTRHLCPYHCILLKKESCNYRVKLQATPILKLVTVQKAHSTQLLWTVSPLP